MSSILLNKSSFAGATKVQSSKRSVARSPVVVRAQQEPVDVVSLRWLAASEIGSDGEWIREPPFRVA